MLTEVAEMQAKDERRMSPLGNFLLKEMDLPAEHKHVKFKFHSLHLTSHFTNINPYIFVTSQVLFHDCQTLLKYVNFYFYNVNISAYKSNVIEKLAHTDMCKEKSTISMIQR